MIPISIVLIDSNKIYRNKLASILEAAGFKLLAQISYEEVEKQFEELAPQVAVLAYKSSRPETLEPARFVKAKFPKVKLIIHTLNTTQLPEDIKVDHFLNQTFDDLSTLVQIIRNFFNQTK